MVEIFSELRGAGKIERVVPSHFVPRSGCAFRGTEFLLRGRRLAGDVQLMERGDISCLGIEVGDLLHSLTGAVVIGIRLGSL